MLSLLKTQRARFSLNGAKAPVEKSAFFSKLKNGLPPAVASLRSAPAPNLNFSLNGELNPC